MKVAYIKNQWLVIVNSILIFTTLSLFAQLEQNTLADKAMVVSAKPEASLIGIQIIEQGGNAVDAAVAVQMALTVVYPRAGNIGGGGFMVLRQANGQAHSLDFREKAPRKAYRDMYLDEKGDVIDRLSLDGHLAVGVPGAVMGCWQMHRKFGKLPWEDLIQPAIDLAEKGFYITSAEAEHYNEFAHYFKKLNTKENSFNQEDKWLAGDKLVQPQLAKTLKLIRDKGAKGFYKGEIAQLIVDEMQRSNGIISKKDLKKYKAMWRKPLQGTYKNDYNIISMPPPSSGGICLLQILGILENDDLGSMPYHGKDAVNLIVEAEKRAYADRSEHLGDPDFYDVPLETLLDKNYLASRRSEIEIGKARSSSEIHPVILGVELIESPETTHFSIVDADGNAVALTTTLNSNYGSKVVVGGAGFFLNNQMDDFSAKPGVPNQFGLIGKEANAIQPQKRMLSSMTPTIVEKNGQLFMVLGTPGGSRIITSVAQNIINVIEYDMGMQESVNQGRFHHQWVPDNIYAEDGCIDETTRKALEEMGYTFKPKNLNGRVDAILVKEDRTLEGAADWRGEDEAVGW